MKFLYFLYLQIKLTQLYKKLLPLGKKIISNSYNAYSFFVFILIIHYGISSFINQ